MSRISDKVREYVNDPTVSDHYGSWGMLRGDQRRKIRELCDTCDAFERILDDLMRERMKWINADIMLPDRMGCYLIANEDDNVFVAYLTNRGWLSPIRFSGKVAFWMPIPELPTVMEGE